MTRDEFRRMYGEFRNEYRRNIMGRYNLLDALLADYTKRYGEGIVDKLIAMYEPVLWIQLMRYEAQQTYIRDLYVFSAISRFYRGHSHYCNCDELLGYSCPMHGDNPANVQGDIPF